LEAPPYLVSKSGGYMTKRTRYFMFGSVGFMALALTAGVAAYYGGVRGFAQPAGPGELAYVPSDAAVVAFANVKDLMGSQFRQQLKGLEPAEQQKGRDELRNTLGIDVENDIEYVVACMLASPTADANQKMGYILANGTFDRPRIEAFIREKGGVEQSYRGKNMFVHEAMVPEAGAEMTNSHAEMGVTFISDRIVAMGNTAALKKVIDLQFGGATVLTNSEVMTMIEGVERGNNAWVVGRFDVLSKQAHLPNGVASQLPQVTWFSAAGHVNGGLNGMVSLQARDAESAKNLQQVAAGFLALANMQASTRPELQLLTKSIQLNADAGNNTVSVSFTLPAAAIDALKNAAASAHQQPK
jgi:hypothetical protein